MTFGAFVSGAFLCGFSALWFLGWIYSGMWWGLGGGLVYLFGSTFAMLVVIFLIDHLVWKRRRDRLLKEEFEV